MQKVFNFLFLCLLTISCTPAKVVAPVVFEEPREVMPCRKDRDCWIGFICVKRKCLQEEFN